MLTTEHFVQLPLPASPPTQDGTINLVNRPTLSVDLEARLGAWVLRIQTWVNGPDDARAVRKEAP